MKVRWRVLRARSSAARAEVGLCEDIALVVGSIVRGSWVKVSGPSIFGFVFVEVCGMVGCVGLLLRWVLFL